jgi:hypothetical protein
VEVLAASLVLTVAVGGALYTLQRTLVGVAHRQRLDAATRTLETELESLRLLDWSQLEALRLAPPASVGLAPAGTLKNVTFTRQVRELRPGLLEIEVVGSWPGGSGQPYQAKLITRRARPDPEGYRYVAP